MPPIFQGVKYHLASTLSEERRDQLSRVLTSHGAAQASTISVATHIIAESDSGFEGWQDVKQENVVSGLWVERSVELKKMQEPSFYSASRLKLFSGVVACSADLGITDEEVISAGIQHLGGQWRMGLTRDVTHLFAVSTTSEKYAIARQEPRIKVLVPNWFDDSILFGLPNLNTETYEWPNPTTLKQRPNSQPTPFRKVKEQQRKSMSPQKRALYSTAVFEPSQSESEVPQPNGEDVWGGRTVLLSTGLELKGTRREIVERHIKQSNGVPLLFSTKDGDGTSEEELHLIDSCEIFITRYRSGPAFFKAWRARKTIGTLQWLLHCQVTGSLSSPRSQLLHFPIPPTKIEGFDKQLITVTNYTGPARDYLKKLISLMGGEFTPSLTLKNTVLIAADKTGSKTSKAEEWSIPVVNHSWLEDCFLRWQNLTPALEKYISFPVGINFGAILGEKPVGSDIDEIIATEAETQGELGGGDDDDVGMEDSQASAEETEVMGGLMPALDVEMDLDVQSDGVDEDGDVRREPSVLSEGNAPAGPSTPSTPSPSKRKLPKKKRVQGLDISSSEDEADPEIMRKVVRIQRTAAKQSASIEVKSKPSLSKSRAKAEPASPTIPKSAAKIAPKKSRDTESERETSEEYGEKPGAPPRKKNLVRRVTGPVAQRRSPRKAVDSPLTARDSPSPSPMAINKLAPLESDDDSDDLPARITIPERNEPRGVIKVPRPSTPVSSKKQQPKTSTHKQATPPSSPLSAPPSPRKIRMPTATVSVEVPVLKTSSSSPKKEPRPRSPSVSAMSHRHLNASRVSVSMGGQSSSPIPSSSRVGTPESTVAVGRAKRTAATQATQRLHDVVMPDVLNYQSEMRNWGRKGRRVSGRSEEWGERDMEEETRAVKKRKVEDGKRRASTSDAESLMSERPAAKAKSRKSEVAYSNGKPIKIVHTKTELSEDVLKALDRLGARVTANSSECTHLIVDKLVRTEKFLCAIAAAPWILDVEWAVKSAEAGKLLPEKDFELSDALGEQKHNVVLKDALKEAKANGGKLFKGMTFYVTAKVRPSQSEVANIIHANGGQAITNHRPSLRVMETNPDRYLISCPAEEAFWRQIAAAHPVYTTELILKSALRQRIDWDDPESKLS